MEKVGRYMKKVQIFIKEYNYGGIEKQVCILANALCTMYNLEIVVLDKVYNKGVDLNKRVKLTELNVKVTDNILNQVKLHNILKKFILHNEADTIISTDMIFNSEIGKYASGKNLIYWEYKLNIPYYANLVESLKHFNRIVLPNEFMKDCYTIKNMEVSIIPLTIEHVPKDASNLKANNIMALGRLNKNKCYDELIEVMNLVHNKNDDIKLYIVGDGEEKEKLRNLVKKYNMNKNIIFKGYLSKEEIGAMMKNTSLFVSAAKSESFGVSIIEAMSYGIPCVSFEHTSLKEFMKNEINGYLISKRDKVKMSEVILEVMSNKKMRESVGNCARETSIIYDINSVKSEWIKII